LFSDDDFLVDDHVDRLWGQRFAAVVRHEPDFSVDAAALGKQIAFHRETIDVLPIAKPKRSVNVAERVDDRAGRRGFE
jgi:hypothetical protein